MRQNRAVTLQSDLRIVMASPKKSSDAQIWVMSTKTPIRWAGIRANRDTWENDLLYRSLMYYAIFLKKKKKKKENLIFIRQSIPGSPPDLHKMLLKRQDFFACDNGYLSKRWLLTHQTNFELSPYLLHVWTSFLWRQSIREGEGCSPASHARME